jgi:hypothetical protein
VRRERILTGEKTLANIGLYEAHLARQLCHALHELDNLQGRRTTGKDVRPLRLDAQGSFDAESLNCKNKPRECAVLTSLPAFIRPTIGRGASGTFWGPAW